MSWEFAPVFDAAHRAALEAGKHLVYVCPPAAWAAMPLFARLTATSDAGLQTLVLAPGASATLALGDSLGSLPDHHPVQLATGLSRTEQLLRAGTIRTLIAAPADALELVRRAALKLEGVRRVVVAWPEVGGPRDATPDLDALLGEAAGAQRLILTSSEPDLADFLERHARRAALVAAARLPDSPGGTLSYAVAGTTQIRAAAAAAVDALAPATVAAWGPGPLGSERDPAAVAQRLPGMITWEPDGPAADLVIALDLPSAPLLAALRTGARDVVVLVGAWQVAYLSRLASPLKALRLPGAPDRAREHVSALRHRLRERLREGALEGELLLLEPLLEEYDGALVAAAALAVGSGSAPAAPVADLPAWVRVRVNLGRRADLRVADLVGALLHGVRLSRDDVGKIDLHDGFTLVDLRPAAAEQAVRELNGMTLRGRRVTAALDRR